MPREVLVRFLGASWVSAGIILLGQGARNRVTLSVCDSGRRAERARSGVHLHALTRLAPLPPKRRFRRASIDSHGVAR